LYTELRHLDIPSMQPFFDDDLTAMLETSIGADVADVTADDVAKTQEELTMRFGQKKETREREVACPKCSHVFVVAN
jgi:hypothetical protein